MPSPFPGSDPDEDVIRPKGSDLPNAPNGKTYLRNPDDNGWTLVPKEWVTSTWWIKSPNGRWQLGPPGTPPDRDANYSQPSYTDAEVYGASKGPAKSPITRPVATNKPQTKATANDLSQSGSSDIIIAVAVLALLFGHGK